MQTEMDLSTECWLPPCSNRLNAFNHLAVELVGDVRQTQLAIKLAIHFTLIASLDDYLPISVIIMVLVNFVSWQAKEMITHITVNYCYALKNAKNSRDGQPLYLLQLKTVSV